MDLATDEICDKQPTECAVCGAVFAREQRNQRRCPECIAARPSWRVDKYARHFELRGCR